MKASILRLKYCQIMCSNSVMKYRQSYVDDSRSSRGWKKYHNEKLYNFYSLRNMVRVEKLGRVWWTEHAARMREEKEEKNAYTVLV
jgi:hypothetical protein